MLKSNDLPNQPPNDPLQRLLFPLQTADPDDLPPPENPDLPGNEDLLQFRPDGTPSWWPLNRDENGHDWSLRQRRNVLFERLRENLPGDFPEQPSTPTELHKLVGSLRHIVYGLSLEASAILNL